jgi:hypothetical protein
MSRNRGSTHFPDADGYATHPRTVPRNACIQVRTGCAGTCKQTRLLGCSQPGIDLRSTRTCTAFPSTPHTWITRKYAKLLILLKTGDGSLTLRRDALVHQWLVIPTIHFPSHLITSLPLITPIIMPHRDMIHKEHWGKHEQHRTSRFAGWPAVGV